VGGYWPKPAGVWSRAQFQRAPSCISIMLHASPKCEHSYAQSYARSASGAVVGVLAVVAVVVRWRSRHGGRGKLPLERAGSFRYGAARRESESPVARRACDQGMRPQHISQLLTHLENTHSGEQVYQGDQEGGRREHGAGNQHGSPVERRDKLYRQTGRWTAKPDKHSRANGITQPHNRIPWAPKSRE
jgi:hypothetical protein